MNPLKLLRRWRDRDVTPAPEQRFILTEDIVIPAGTELRRCDKLGFGGLRTFQDRGFVKIYVGRAEALRDGMIKARPALKVVK